MNWHEWLEYFTEEGLRKYVKYWAKKNPNTIDFRTHIVANRKRYCISICRSDYKQPFKADKEGEQE